MNRKAIVMLVVALALAIAGCGGKGVPKTVATVDGKQISGTQFYQNLNATAGKTAMTSLVEQQILLNWAEAEKVPVTESQIDKQLDTLKRTGIYEIRLDAFGGLDALRDSYGGAQATTNLAEKFYKFTDDELMTTYNSPDVKHYYVHGPTKRVEIIANSDPKPVAQALKDIKNGMSFDGAAMKYSGPMFSSSGPAKVVVWPSLRIPGLQSATAATKIGEVSKPFTFALMQFGQLQQFEGVVKVIGEVPKSDLKFADVKDEVRGLAALQKAMSDPGFQRKLQDRKSKADIKMNLAQYWYVADQVKSPPPPEPMPMAAPNVKPGPAPNAPKTK